MKLILILSPSELKRRGDGDRDRDRDRDGDKDRDGEIGMEIGSRAEERSGVERRVKSCLDSQDMIC